MNITKYRLTFFLASIILMGCGGKAKQLSKTEQEFVGEWSFSDVRKSDEKDTKLTKELNLSDDGSFSLEVSVVLDVKVWGERMGGFQRGTEIEEALEGSMMLKGKWEIRKDLLYLFFDEDCSPMKLSKTPQGVLACLSSDTPKEIKDEMDSLIEVYEMGNRHLQWEEFDISTSYKIISMDNSSMTLESEYCNQETFLRKDDKGNPDYIFKPDVINAPEENETLSEQLKVKSSENNLVDGDNKTAWAIDLSESNFDEMIYLYGPNLHLNATRIDAIEIVNGNAESRESWENSTRAAWILIYRVFYPDAGDPEPENILYSGPLEDTMDVQRLQINPEYDNSYPTEVLCITFSNKEADKFYHGSEQDNLAISEISIYGSE